MEDFIISKSSPSISCSDGGCKKFERFIKNVYNDFTDVKFIEAEACYWNPYENEVGFVALVDDRNWQVLAILLLHELAHAKLGHKEYDFDMELIDMEVEAWGLVEDELAQMYNLDFDRQIAQQRLDTYQAWLLERSKCPSCDAYGYQQPDFEYLCLQCRKAWKPNDNRFKHIRKKESEAKPIFCDFGAFDKLLK